MRLTLGEQVRFHRTRAGLTQTELASRVGRGPKWIHDLERDRARLSYSEMIAISEAIGSELVITAAA